MLIQSLIELTNSHMKAQELFLLLNNIKPLIRHGYYEHELPQIEQFCVQHSLHLVKSPFKVLLDDNTLYTNRGLRLPLTDPRPGMLFIYISTDEKTANLALLSELQNNHSQLGHLLCYPGCCINFFTTSFNDQHTNLQHPPTNPWTNLTKREQDYCFLSHFPCQSNCKESIALAKLYFEVLNAEEPEYAQKVLKVLTI